MNNNEIESAFENDIYVTNDKIFQWNRVIRRTFVFNMQLHLSLKLHKTKVTTIHNIQSIQPETLDIIKRNVIRHR